MVLAMRSVSLNFSLFFCKINKTIAHFDHFEEEQTKFKFPFSEKPKRSDEEIKESGNSKLSEETKQFLRAIIAIVFCLVTALIITTILFLFFGSKEFLFNYI